MIDSCYMISCRIQWELRILIDQLGEWIRRYHNNIDYIGTNLLRDLIFFRLPISPYSLSVLLETLTTGSTLADSIYNRKQIKDLCFKYHSSCILDLYTQDTFFHKVLNHVLRQKQHHVIYQYRHAIINLINSLRLPLPSEEDSISLTLYRGQQMTIFELEKMKNNVGELISSTSFLSTTLNLKIAQIFAGDGSDDNSCLVLVIFKIYLDTGEPMRPYVLINKSAEEEVLFSPGTRFVLISCRKLHDNGRLWLFELQAIPEKQQEQLTLTHGETFSLLSSASGWPTSVVIVRHLIT